MILAFQNQFIPYVLDGSKTHTIRAGHRWKAGMRADLYSESRRRKVYELRATNIPPGCICRGDGLYGMRCDAPVHAPERLEYQQQQVSGMRLLFRAQVVRVESIHIYSATGKDFTICLQGYDLSPAECDLFAYRDGFRTGCTDSQAYGTVGAFEQMMEFWKRKHKLPFHGQVIHWNYAERFTTSGLSMRKGVHR